MYNVIRLPHAVPRLVRMYMLTFITISKKRNAGYVRLTSRTLSIADTYCGTFVYIEKKTHCSFHI